MPKPHASLVAVVVTFNRLAQLQTTIARLLETAPQHLTAIIVVDNACTDGTPDWLQTQTDPRLTVLRLPQNGGGAGGFEVGMRHATAQFNPDWMVVMDDDARPHPGCLAAFHAKPRDSAQGWAAAVYHPDGRICDMNRPSINPFWHPEILRRTLLGGGRNGFHLGPADYSATTDRDIDGTSFVGFFISRAGVALAGYPDGRLFLYGDDVLYTLGLRAAGGRIAFAPDLKFDHDFSTMSDADRRFRPLWKTYYHYRNLLMVYRVAAGPWFWPVLPAILLKWLIKIRYHGGERGRYLALLLRAYRDGILRRTDVTHAQVLAWARGRKP
jgi:GT2 family glycosyltransferase